MLHLSSATSEFKRNSKDYMRGWTKRGCLWRIFGGCNGVSIFCYRVLQVNLSHWSSCFRHSNSQQLARETCRRVRCGGRERGIFRKDAIWGTIRKTYLSNNFPSFLSSVFRYMARLFSNIHFTSCLRKISVLPTTTTTTTTKNNNNKTLFTRKHQSDYLQIAKLVGAGSMDTCSLVPKFRNRDWDTLKSMI